jgi:hypothetical protein
MLLPSVYNMIILYNLILSNNNLFVILINILRERVKFVSSRKKSTELVKIRDYMVFCVVVII